MEKNRLLALFAIISLILGSIFFSGCGGGGGSNGGSTAPTVLHGVFADAPVDGIDYKTATQAGATSDGGKFKYVDGETVTFSIGNTTLGSTAAKAVLTPVDLVAGATDQTNSKVTKIVQLILSLSDNPNAATLNIGAANLAAMKTSSAMDFTADQARFETAINLVTRATPVSSTAAQSHLAATLGTICYDSAGTLVFNSNSTQPDSCSTPASLPAGYIQQGGLTWTPNTIGGTTLGNPYDWDAGGYTDWPTANNYCANATINGQTGWRLPTKDELDNLYKSGALAGKPGWALENTWSSTPNEFFTPDGEEGGHSGIDLSDGSVSIWNQAWYASYVTCVR